ncbi:MAG TPA: ATPase, T2SS/T4P/T4SS family [Gaiellaceae bacterium]|nr:ATPase, T2SS/T4P/T4SS family [Gaiellaceae bacterium]
MTDTAYVEAAFPPPLPAELYAAPEGRPQLGSLLLRDGAITLDQLEASLAEKEANGGRLGEILVRHGFASSSQVARALADQHGLDYLDLGRFEVDPAATSLLPENIARRLGALPISFAEDDVVLIAVSDPTDVIASDDLRLALGLQIRLAVVSADDLTRTRERCYRNDLIVQLDDEPEQFAPVEDIRDGLATSAPAIKLANQIISKAIEDGASDIHFEPQTHAMVVRARIDGVMRRVGEVPKSLQPAITSRLKIMGELDIADRRIPQDGRMSIRYGGSPMDLRVAVLPTTYGEQVVLRILHRASGRLGLADLGMSPEAEATLTRAVKQPYGAVLAVGPTGSGKTTTLYAALEYLNDESRALATIEDPVEYQIPGVNQVEVNARAGLTFSRGLRTMLRSDPDVLLVGEVRDEETARIAIQAAMTGHLVLTTLHTHNAASAIARLRDMGVEQTLLATSINCIVAQRLARRLCVHCREPYTPTAEALVAESADGIILETETLYRARGCPECASTGYAGRVALYEVMPVVGKIRRLIEASTEEIFAAAVEAGMTTLREDGIRLCRAGISSLDEIRRVTGDRLQ